DPRVSDSACSEVKDRRRHVAPFPTGGLYTKDLSGVGSAPCHSCDHYITGIDQFMNLRTQVGKCIPGLPQVVLESLNPDRAIAERPSEAQVGREDLVRHGQVPCIPEVMMKAAHGYDIWCVGCDELIRHGAPES